MMYYDPLFGAECNDVLEGDAGDLLDLNKSETSYDDLLDALMLSTLIIRYRK